MQPFLVPVDLPEKRSWAFACTLAKDTEAKGLHIHTINVPFLVDATMVTMGGHLQPGRLDDQLVPQPVAGFILRELEKGCVIKKGPGRQ
eukprot:1157706-Pelagomonas_calceolata.AAC.12